VKRRRVDFKKRIHNQPRKKLAWLEKINIFKYLSFLLIFLFILSTPLIIKKLIKVNKIECISQFGDCPSELKNKLQLAGGRDYYIAKNYIENELKNDISVENYLIQYKIPSTIKVDLNLKKPKFAIKNNEKYFLVNKEGLVLNIVSETNLPVLVSNVDLSLGGRLDDNHLFALKLIEKISFLYTIVSNTIENNELKILTTEKLVRLPLEGDVDLLVGSLRLIFSRLNEASQGIRMEDVAEIDLRFQSPILR
jgi:cell division protein FtsQ